MLFLIRHGQSEANAGMPTSDYTAVELTSLGYAQAQAVANGITEPPTRIVLSPYRRAQQTAEPTRLLYPTVPVLELPVQEFTYIDQQRCQGMTATERQPLVDAYWKQLDPEYRDSQEVESFVDLQKRAMNFLQLAKEWDGVTVVFTHEQFIRAVLLLTLSGDKLSSHDAMKRFYALRTGLPISNGSISHLRRDGDCWWFGGVKTAHLSTDSLV